MSQRFRTNGWQGTWTYTVYDFWHYHVDGYEVLGCVAGEAEIGFGGEAEDGGIAATMRPGDVVLIPAGVGHKRLSATADFAVVGAYPPGQNGADRARRREGSGRGTAGDRGALPCRTRTRSAARPPGVLEAWR